MADNAKNLTHNHIYITREVAEAWKMDAVVWDINALRHFDLSPGPGVSMGPAPSLQDMESQCDSDIRFQDPQDVVQGAEYLLGR